MPMGSVSTPHETWPAKANILRSVTNRQVAGAIAGRVRQTPEFKAMGEVERKELLDAVDLLVGGIPMVMVYPRAQDGQSTVEHVKRVIGVRCKNPQAAVDAVSVIVREILNEMLPDKAAKVDDDNDNATDAKVVPRKRSSKGPSDS